ncbi:MAG: tail fiber domain-containing protein [Deltaproteobacteria bacterium]|nr:MAG: tail fiber domain-containing protein [Deltaproteobacteria bacterium]
MKRLSWINAMVLCLLCTMAFNDCSTSNTNEATNADSGTTKETSPTETSPTDNGGSGGLTWFTTCGDPVCSSYRSKSNIATCTVQKEGASCNQDGAQCDIANNNCNRLLRCSKTDPKQQPGGCPISLRKYKKEIRYLGPNERAKLYRHLMQLKLATYRYKQAGPKSRQRLGFMIDDNPHSLAIDPQRDQIDLYAYTSMVVAAMQQQARTLKQLQQQIKALQKTCKPKAQ